MRVALSDGTLAKSGGKVIKNVAGYDIAKLFTGSFGTLGAIVELAVRLHPLPPETATALGGSADPASSRAAPRRSRGSALEHHGLDVRWEAGRGQVLARFAGAAPRPQAEAAERLLRREGLSTEIVDDDDAGLGRAARRAARAARGEGVRAAHAPARSCCARPTSSAASLVGRAALGRLVAQVRGAVRGGGRAPAARVDRRGAGPAGRARRRPVGRAGPRRAPR